VSNKQVRLHMTFVGILIIAITYFTYTYRLPWGEDFEKNGTFTGALVCDAGHTRYTIYKGVAVASTGDDMEKYKPESYMAATVAINNKVVYYMYSPSPDLVIPDAYSYKKDEKGFLRQVKEIDLELKEKTPNLYNKLNLLESDCIEEYHK
jgi:hypothetical protein